MNRKERFDLAHWAVDRALKAGADQAAVGLNFARRIEVEFRDKKLDKLQEATENGLYLQVYVPGAVHPGRSGEHEIPHER